MRFTPLRGPLLLLIGLLLIAHSASAEVVVACADVCTGRRRTLLRDRS